MQLLDDGGESDERDWYLNIRKYGNEKFSIESRLMCVGGSNWPKFSQMVMNLEGLEAN